MIRLNLPTFEIKLSGTRQHPLVFDTLRHRFVALTPEEWVRQHFVHYLTGHLGYPPALLSNEVKLSVGQKELRADSVLYDRYLRPLMIMEYKAPTVEITQNLFDQILAYATQLHTPWLVASNGITHFCYKWSNIDEKYLQFNHIPNYEEILQN